MVKPSPAKAARGCCGAGRIVPALTGIKAQRVAATYRGWRSGTHRRDSGSSLERRTTSHSRAQETSRDGRSPQRKDTDDVNRN
jgi:hypothetical protein